MFRAFSDIILYCLGRCLFLSGMHQMLKDTATWNCQALDLAKMSQNIKKAFKMSIITQKVNKTGGKINLPRIWLQPCKKMDPTWPYASSRAFYMHLEQWIQTQGFPLDTKKLIVASRRPVLYIHSIPPAQPALRCPVHLEKPINLIVSPPVSPASPQPRNMTNGQTINSAT